jgi:hypothetical protein
MGATGNQYGQISFSEVSSMHRLLEEIAQRSSISTEAVLTVLAALVAGHGTMAQFHHPELGGAGQWMQGGMTISMG